MLLFFIFLSYNAFAGQYDVAIDNVKTATYIQTGLQNKENQIRNYGEFLVKKNVNKAGLTKPAKVLVLFYAIYKNRSMQIPITNNKKIELQLNQIQFKMELP